MAQSGGAAGAATADAALAGSASAAGAESAVQLADAENAAEDDGRDYIKKIINSMGADRFGVF